MVLKRVVLVLLVLCVASGYPTHLDARVNYQRYWHCPFNDYCTQKPLWERRSWQWYYMYRPWWNWYPPNGKPDPFYYYYYWW